MPKANNDVTTRTTSTTSVTSVTSVTTPSSSISTTASSRETRIVSTSKVTPTTVTSSDVSEDSSITTVPQENETATINNETIDISTVTSQTFLIREETTLSTTQTKTETETTTSITMLEEEVPEVSNISELTSSVTVPTENTGFDLEEYLPFIECGLIIILVIASLSLYFKAQKKRKNEKSARQLDRERINKERNEKKSKKNEKKKSKFLSLYSKKTVLDTLPYKKCLDNDIWLIDDHKYSKVYQIDDINYNLGDETQQKEMCENYENFLNTLDETIICQITVWNNQIDIKKHEEAILIKERNDGYNDIRKEYNERVLKTGLSRGQNAIKKSIYITMTIECPDEETARRKFNSIDLATKNSFDHVGNTNLKVLTNQERVEMLKNFYNGTEYKIPTFSSKDYKKGLEKTYIAPIYFEFKKDYFMFGEYYATCLFIKDYPNTMVDFVLTELMNTNLEIIVTTNILSYEPAIARTKVQHQITNINAEMGERESKAAKHGYFSTTMPVKVRNRLESYKELFDMITIYDERLFQANTIIMLKTQNHNDLKNGVELINSTLKRLGCKAEPIFNQQAVGMTDCLPVGSQMLFEWDRSLPTESISIFNPFNVKEIQQENAIYYGLNKLSNNMITVNRIKSLINPAGYILGCPGGGKSFAGKREMCEVYMRYPEAEIIIIDPEREYPPITEMFNGQSIKVSTGSKAYINPFDFDFSLIDDEEYDVIKEKAQLIASFISCMYTNRPLTPQEISFIDRCVRITYFNSHVLETLDKSDMPILEDFYRVIENETENVDEKMKQDMLATLEMYVGEGSANYFNHQTNVDIYNRLVSFDIKDLTGVLKTQAMLLVLDLIWNRLSANREKKIPTWIYCDEIHVLFADDYCRTFFQSLYKRARKYGGVLTGITQNVTDLLRNEESCTMLANSEYLLLLKQSPPDARKLQEVLHFTDSEIFYVSNVATGEGLMVLGIKDKLPFYDKFPADTKMYKSMTTSFSETQALMSK